MMKPDELYDAFEAEEQNGLDRRRAIFLKALDEIAAVKKQNAELRKQIIEERAKLIYEKMEFAGPGIKPAWVEHGNSLKQDEARRIASRLLEEKTK